jgi:hypothetical protein
LSYGYEQASKADVLKYVEKGKPLEPCHAYGSCELESASEVESVIEELAGFILELQSKFRVSASHGYSSEALRYGHAFKALLQLHDSLVPQYEKWHIARWGKPPAYCKLQGEEFAIEDQQTPAG